MGLEAEKKELVMALVGSDQKLREQEETIQGLKVELEAAKAEVEAQKKKVAEQR